MPVDRVLNKIFQASPLHYQEFGGQTLPLIILTDICTNIRCKTCLNRFADLNKGVEREELGIRAHALNSERIGRYKRNMLGLHNLINVNCSCIRQLLCITLLTYLHCKVNLLTILWEKAAEEASERKRMHYANLAAEVEDQGWKVSVHLVDVGWSLIASSTAGY